MGYGPEALEASRQLDSLVTRSRSRNWTRRAGTLAGLVNADIGNVAGAIIRYAGALEAARETADHAGELSLYVNLAVALNYGGLYRESIACSERAALLSRTDTVIADCAAKGIRAEEIGAAALNNKAQSHLYLEEFRAGFETISQCLSTCPEPTDAMTSTSRAIREFTYVQLALELGKFALARTHVDLSMHYGRQGGEKGTVVAHISRGLFEVYAGTPEAGVEMLERLLSEYQTTSAQTSILTALVKAHEQIGQPELALGYARRLLECMKGTREKGLHALLSLGDKSSVIGVQSSTDGLQNLKLREAELRAKVAEKSALDARIEMLERLAITADLKEEASGEHGYRVGKLASLLAEELNWSRDACFAIDLAARLHDIGKIGVPDRILLNSKELMEAERHFMSTHTIIGAELLAKSNIPQLKMAEDIARCHHEWWDGSGYPSKLAGKRIPLHARIVALADVFDALTHGRPFAQPWPIDRAIEEIRTRRGTQFDPELTDLFLDLVARLRAEHDDLDGYLGKAGRNSPFLQARNKIRLMLAEERQKEQKATVAGNETRH